MHLILKDDQGNTIDAWRLCDHNLDNPHEFALLVEQIQESAETERVKAA